MNHGSKFCKFMDTFSKTERSYIMFCVKGENNKSTELKLITLFRKHDITGWRRKYKLAGKPDFVFPKRKTAVFVDGCFWHGCQKHLRMPSSNRTYWERKIGKNIERDRAVNEKLAGKGWNVIRIWEHDLKNVNSVPWFLKLL